MDGHFQAAPKGQDTRARIMDIAQTAVLQKGFDATSIEEIVAEADLSRDGFFYSHLIVGQVMLMRQYLKLLFSPR